MRGEGGARQCSLLIGQEGITTQDDMKVIDKSYSGLGLEGSGFIYGRVKI